MLYIIFSPLLKDNNVWINYCLKLCEFLVLALSTGLCFDTLRSNNCSFVFGLCFDTPISYNCSFVFGLCFNTLRSNNCSFVTGLCFDTLRSFNCSFVFCLCFDTLRFYNCSFVFGLSHLDLITAAWFSVPVYWRLKLR